MSSYDNDPRVVPEGDGYRLPDLFCGDWHIRPTPHGGWTAEGDYQAHTDEGDRYNTRLKVYPSADAAIGSVIGPPANIEEGLSP